MESTSTYFYFSRLLARYFSQDSLSEEEFKDLEVWKNENPHLFIKILNEQNRDAYKKAISLVDADQAWNKVSHSINSNKFRIDRFKGFMKFAATLLILIGLTATLYYTVFYKEKMSIKGMGTAEIVTGKPQAQLILDDGQSHNLQQTAQKILLEKGELKIKTAHNTINYLDSSIRFTKIKNLYNTIVTPRGGGDYSVVLSDSSKLYVNSMSKVKYPVKFSGDYREVEILEGEAFIEVVENKTMPFIVKTKNARLKVLGTSFNVSAYSSSNELIITLETGLLEVINLKHNNEVKILTPDQQARINNNKPGAMEISEVDAGIYSSWRRGMFEFKNERLDVIMKTLSRWYNIEVFYEFESLKSIRFGGNLNKYSDINSLLDLISMTKKVKIETDKNYILFTKND